MNTFLNIFFNATFWQALSAIGTLVVAFLAIYLPIKEKKAEYKLDITQKQTIHLDNSYIIETFTVNNVGNRSIVIEEIGFLNENHTIDITCKKYLAEEFKPTLIECGKIKLIEFKYIIPPQYHGEDFEKIDFFKQFKCGYFAIRDSRGKIYKTNSTI